MRRLGVVVAAVCGVIAVAGGGAAFAAPAPSGSAAAPGGAGQPVCSVNDSRLQEISGLVAVDNGYLAVNDSNPDTSAMRIYRLDGQCKVQSTTAYPSNALDPEDIAVASDGTVWVADIGDNDAKRTTVALWKLAPNERTPVIHRVTYPDGARDAEALLINGDGTPVIVTKEAGKPGIYVPSGPLVPRSNTGVALKRAGQFDLPSSTTPNGIGPPGRLVVTGGATAPDGKRVALRTYADALEWDVSGGDVVKALTSGKPRVTPLPNEPQGEAITYSRDGATFVTVSEVPAGRASPLLRYTPAPPAPAAVQTAAGGSGDDSGGFASGLTIDDITYLVAAVGVLGLVVVVIGVVAIRRSREARRKAARAGGAPGRGPGGPGGGGPGGGPGGAPGGGAGRATVRSNAFDDFDEPTTRGAGTGAAARGAGAGRGGPVSGGRGGGSERTGSVYRTGDIRAGSGAAAGPGGSGGSNASGGRAGGVYGGRRDQADAGRVDGDPRDDPRGYGRR